MTPDPRNEETRPGEEGIKHGPAAKGFDGGAGKGDPSQERPVVEPVWTYRGYQLRASEFTTAMVHFFRAEVQRANVWRQRLDTTTNWAVVATGATISIAFTQVATNHVVILLNLVLISLFLSIEARRYRYYELWSYRVRLMETDFFASMLVPPFHPSADWAEALAENLLHPDFPISAWEAVGRRLRRNYFWIYAVIGAVWLAKLWLHPFTPTSWEVFVQRARVGSVPGDWVLLGILAFYLALIGITLGTLGLQQSAGEVLPRYGGLHGTAPGRAETTGRAWFRPTRRRQQLLTFIITDRAKAVTERILKEMNRGVTALAGTGMYTGSAHSVLMCALALTEVPQLKALVRSEDPNAFVVVSPAQEVFGRGFSSLQEDS